MGFDVLEDVVKSEKEKKEFVDKYEICLDILKNVVKVNYSDILNLMELVETRARKEYKRLKEEQGEV